MEPKTIGATLRRADKSNEHATLTVYHCSLPGNCPLLEQKQCIHVGLFSSCKFGYCSVQTTKSKRSKSYYTELTKLEELKDQIGCLPGSVNQSSLLVLGDWVYLPYSHMNHLDGKRLKIPFERYSSVFTSGDSFMKLSDFTAETIISILKLRPHALMGGEILSYQQNEVPRFVLHLAKAMPKLFEEVALKYPRIKEIYDAFAEKEIPNFQAPIFLVPKDCVEGFTVSNKIQVLSWDGVTLKVNTKDAPYFFGGAWVHPTEGSSSLLEFVPRPEFNVTITSSHLKKLIVDQHPEYFKVK